MNLLEQIKNDVYPDSQPDYSGQERQLMWVSDIPLSMQKSEDVKLLKECFDAIGEYNAFDPENVFNIISEYNFTGQIILAREYSVCLYLILEDDYVVYDTDNFFDDLDADEMHNAVDDSYIREKITSVLQSTNQENIEDYRIWRIWWD